MHAVLTDPQRLAALRGSGLLEAVADPAIERVARLAARALGANVATVTLVEADRLVIAASHGLPEQFASMREIPHSYSFCTDVARIGKPVVIDDVIAHVADHGSDVVDEFGMRAYVGVPLVAHGHVIGSVCAMAVEPRVWSGADLEVLLDLAAVIAREVEPTAAPSAHDLRTPLTSIAGYVELLREEGDKLDARQREFVEVIARNTARLLEHLD